MATKNSFLSWWQILTCCFFLEGKKPQIYRQLTHLGKCPKGHTFNFTLWRNRRRWANDWRVLGLYLRLVTVDVKYGESDCSVLTTLQQQVQLTREITRSQLEIRLMLVSAPGTDIPRNQFVAWPLNNALVISKWPNCFRYCLTIVHCRSFE